MSHQKGRLKNSKFWLCLSLILCLVSAIVASAVQTSGGIRIKEMSWESPSGHQLAAYLYIPQNATKDTPAPGVVTIEGWYNNKEMQDLYSIELARRGYVVLALDLHSHGDSESLSMTDKVVSICLLGCFLNFVHRSVHTGNADRKSVV